MFMPTFQKWFERIRPIYQPFLGIIVAASIFGLLGFAVTVEGLTTSQSHRWLAWMLFVGAVNCSGMLIVRKYRRAAFFYLLQYCCSLMLPVTCALPLPFLIPEPARSQAYAILILLIVAVYLVYFWYYSKVIEFDSMRKRGLLSESDSSEWFWSATAFRKLDEGYQESAWFRWFRYLTPFLPALGMAFSRSLNEEGYRRFMAFLFEAVVCLELWAFVKHLVLSIRLSQWEKQLDQVILVEE